MEHLPGTAVHASAVHADDLLYLLHVLHWHELPFQEDATLI
jgi:hypothetical protein